MTTDELWDLLRGELAELKADQKETCKYVKELNGRVLKNTWNIRAIWILFGCAKAALLVWVKAKLS